MRIRPADPPGRDYGTEGDVRDRILTVGLLLEAGVDPNRLLGTGRPIAIAILSGSEEATRLLVSHGADPDLQEMLGLMARFAGRGALYARAVAWRREYEAKH